MPDNLNERRPLDATRVNIHEAWEIQYWCGKLRCTEAELKRAVAAVGTSATLVERYLKK